MMNSSTCYHAIGGEIVYYIPYTQRSALSSSAKKDWLHKAKLR